MTQRKAKSGVSYSHPLYVKKHDCSKHGFKHDFFKEVRNMFSGFPHLLTFFRHFVLDMSLPFV